MSILLLALLLGLTSIGVDSSGGSGLYNGSRLYYVRPTIPANTTCPGQPCLTLDEYVENGTENFVSDIKMVFLPGEHKLSLMLDVASVTNVKFVSYNKLDAHIMCDSPGLSLTFTNITVLTISGLHVSGCGASRGTISLNKVMDFQLLHASISGDGFNTSGLDVELLGDTNIEIYVNNSEFTRLYSGISAGCQNQPNCSVSLTIENSVVSNISGYGINVVTSGQTSVHINNSQIVGNGLSLWFGYNDPASSTTIIENTVLMFSQDTPLILEGGNSVLLRNVTIAHNDALINDFVVTLSSIPNVTIVNCTFFNNTATPATPSLTYNSYVLSLYSTPNVNIVNSTFTNNTGTPIGAHNSNFTLAGTIIFASNTGYQGGAIALYENSRMNIQNHTHITFKNNHARHVGGAIFVYICPIDAFTQSCHHLQSPELCFLALNVYEDDMQYLDVKLNFMDNTAENGGSVLYGGKIDQCRVTNTGENITFGSQFFADNNFVSIQSIATTDLSLITSDPSRVCLCSDGMTTDCWTVFSSKTVYPGEVFRLPAVVVGQNFGTVTGPVYGQFIPLAGNRGSTRLREGSQSQGTSLQKCVELHYSILTENMAEVLVLTSSNIPVSQFPDSETMCCLNTSHCPSFPKGYITQELLSTPIYINITLLPCPPGFMMSHDHQCVCDRLLQEHNIPCNITTQTVHRSQSMWINASFHGSTSNGVIINNNCPFEYCNSKVLKINLDNPDTQCAFSHSGTLCGGCKPGFSLTLGSSQCRSCTNIYLTRLIAFAVAGLALVFFIKILNLTVAQGTINGLIFYANIVWANQAVFFPARDRHPLTVFMAWLNLDLGIETCFFDGLDGYYKTWLQFVFPLYIWAIVVLVIVLAHYSTTAAKIFGNNSVPVLATLIFLSYAKLLRTIINIVHFSILDYSDGSSKAVWSFDGNIRYLSPMHAPLFAVAIAFLLFLWLPYMGILTFAQHLQRVTNYRIMRWFVKLKPFFDAYFGPLQDKHRYWVGFLLLVRGVLFVIFATSNSPTVNLKVVAATMFALLMYLAYIGHIYRKKYLTLLENSSIMNLAVFAVATFYVQRSKGSQSALVVISVGIALAQFIAILIFHLIALGRKISFERFWRHFMAVKTMAEDDQDGYENLDREEDGVNRQNAQRMVLTYGEGGELELREETEIH